jgi:ubiquitin-like 1-activating enzyme E1 B
MEYDLGRIGSFAVSSLSVSIDLELNRSLGSPNHPISDAPFILPSPLPRPVPKVKPPPAPVTPPRTSTKRPLPLELADGVLDLDPTPKKPKLAAGVVAGISKRKFEDHPSPSKRRRLEDEGLVLMDGPDEVLDTGDVMEVLEEDYILIDGD